MDVDRGVPEVYASEFDARVLMDAFYELNDRKSLHELVNKTLLKDRIKYSAEENTWYFH